MLPTASHVGCDRLVQAPSLRLERPAALAQPRLTRAGGQSGQPHADASGQGNIACLAFATAAAVSSSARSCKRSRFRSGRPSNTRLYQADPESLRWALELALHAGDKAAAERLRKAIPAVEIAQPVAALDALLQDRVQRALAQALDKDASTSSRRAAVRKLEVLATPPGASEKAEDALHQILSESGDEDVAEEAERSLWAAWLLSGEEAVDLIMREGLEFMSKNDLQAAINSFTRATEAAPVYAEGWNKRATALFLDERFEESIQDCHKVLELKPRHFGCLSGLGICHLRRGNQEVAARWLRKALDVNPRSSDVRRIVDDLETRSAEDILKPRIQAVIAQMKRGLSSDAPSSPTISSKVLADWDARPVHSDDKCTYYFRVRIECVEGPPVCGVARYYALQQGNAVIPLSRMTQGPASYQIRPGQTYRYSFMLSFTKELGAAQGGLLLRSDGEIFELGLDRLTLHSAPPVLESDLASMNQGYRFMGRLDIRIED